MTSPAPPPLTGITVLEFAGLAPGPFAGMLLADAGASVLRIDRPGSTATNDGLARRKASIGVDLKSTSGVALVQKLAKTADILIDPFRPGVLEKLGLGPDVLLSANPRLIYARMTGFRRDGIYANMAGHDINYLSISGALSLLGRRGDRPTPPINILGDFAGGGAMLVHAILLALLSRASSGKGQVVEANMVDGASYLSTFPRNALKTPAGNRPRGENLLDSGCPYYDTYMTADGRYVAVGALEPAFFRLMLEGIGLDGIGWEERRDDPASWPALRKALTEKFGAKSRDHWEKVFAGSDACVTPVLDYRELEAGRAEGTREGDMRPAVTLRETPLLRVERKGQREEVDPAAQGQGDGVPGDGYAGIAMVPGHGGEEALAKWFGIKRGEYEVGSKGFSLGSQAKL